MHNLSTVAGAASGLIKTTNRTDFSFHPLKWTPSGREPYIGKAVKASNIALFNSGEQASINPEMHQDAGGITQRDYRRPFQVTEKGILATRLPH